MNIFIHITLFVGASGTIGLVLKFIKSLLSQWLSARFDKQVLDYLRDLNGNTSVTIVKGDTLYKVDKNDDVTFRERLW